MQTGIGIHTRVKWNFSFYWIVLSVVAVVDRFYSVNSNSGFYYGKLESFLRYKLEFYFVLVEIIG